MEGKTNVFETLYERLEKYIELSIKIAVYKSLDKASGFVSSVIIRIFLFFLFILFFTFLNIAIGFLLGDRLGKTWYGFSILSGFYFLAGLLILLFNKKIQKALGNLIIKEILGK